VIQRSRIEPFHITHIDHPFSVSSPFIKLGYAATVKAAVA
jgi:hypothetical protein